MKLYKAKNKERNKFDLRLDLCFLIGSLWVPLAGFVIATRSWLQPWPGIVWQCAVILYLGLMAFWIGRQIQKGIRNEPLNLPKIGLIAAVAPLQWLAFHHATENGPDGIIRAGIALGLFHSLQYHRLLWS